MTTARRERLLAGLFLSGLATGFWLAFGFANGPSAYNDTPTYLRVADALQHFRVVSSIRTPGYPLFLTAGRALAAALGTDFSRTVMVLQVVLLSGLATYLVYDLGWRLSGRVSVGAVAALLVAGDADLQNFTGYLLTESLTVALSVVALWLRVRYGDWRWAAWVLAYLALTRPNYVFFPFAFAALDAVRCRRARPALEVACPTLAVLAAWLSLAFAAGADPLTPIKWFVPMHTFGKVYEQDLWVAMPDGPERDLLARERSLGHSPYQARIALERLGGPGSAWRLSRAVVRANPLAYARVCVSILRRQFRQGSLLEPVHPRPGWLAAVRRWRAVFRAVFYASFPLFMALLALAALNGMGWPAATAAFRTVLGPFVAVLFVTTAMSSMGNWDAGRLSLAFHPVNALLWALAMVKVAGRVRATVRRVPRGEPSRVEHA